MSASTTGRKRCRRCWRFFAAGDLYSGCRLCQPCYRQSVAEATAVLHRLTDEGGIEMPRLRVSPSSPVADLTPEELGVLVTALAEFIDARDRSKPAHSKPLAAAFAATRKLAALAPGFSLRAR